MTNRIAIIDFLNQDVGLKILFPEADYFILQEEFDRTQIYSKYNIKPIVHNKDVNVYEHVTSNKYNIVFIIAALYNSIEIYNNKKNTAFQLHIHEKLKNIKSLINKNNFDKVCFFDNYDYDYDPNIIFHNSPCNNIYFFKRYYNKEKLYNTNVFQFPYIIFGHQCNIDMITDRFNKKKEEQKQSRIFFSGSLMNHKDNTYGVYRNRIEIMNRIVKKVNIYNPGHVNHDTFIKILSTSKYCLDLLGVGDPNIRTFEILSSKSLRISQRSNLKWNFEDEFCEETIFQDENELLEKIVRLENDPQLYQECLDKQNEIVRKHMNIGSLRSYILDKININIT